VVAGSVAENFLRNRAKDRIEIVSIPEHCTGFRATSFGQVDAWWKVWVQPFTISVRRGLPICESSEIPVLLCVEYRCEPKYPLLFSAVQKLLPTFPGEIENIQKRWIFLEMRAAFLLRLKFACYCRPVFRALLVSLTGITYALKRRLKEKLPL
jgi:hypothetical protein